MQSLSALIDNQTHGRSTRHQLGCSFSPLLKGDQSLCRFSFTLRRYHPEAPFPAVVSDRSQETHLAGGKGSCPQEQSLPKTGTEKSTFSFALEKNCTPRNVLWLKYWGQRDSQFALEKVVIIFSSPNKHQSLLN